MTTDDFERNWMASWGRHVTGPFPLPPSGLTPSPRNGVISDQLSRQRIGYTSDGEFVGIGGDSARNIDLHSVDNPANFLGRPDTEKLSVFLDALKAGSSNRSRFSVCSPTTPLVLGRESRTPRT